MRELDLLVSWKVRTMTPDARRRAEAIHHPDGTLCRICEQCKADAVAQAVRERDEEIAQIREDYLHCHCPFGTPIRDGVCQRCSRVIAGCD